MTYTKIIHFFNYLEYENVEELNLDFMFPIKNDSKPHLYAKLNTPIYFYLPKSIIGNVYSNEYGENLIHYEIDLEEHIDILQFFDNLDTVSINKTILNCGQWFKKNLDQNKLVQSYINIYYNDEKNEKILANFYVSSKYVEKIKEYNDNSSLNLLIKIDCLEFIRNKWRLKLEVVEIVEGLESLTNNADDNSNDDDLDFSEMLSIEEKNPKENLYTSNENNLNTEILDELANDYKNYNQNYNIKNKQKLDEIRESINKKKMLKKELLLNSEKARQGIESNKEKIFDLDSEIETLHLQIESV